MTEQRRTGAKEKGGDLHDVGCGGGPCLLPASHIGGLGLFHLIKDRSYPSEYPVLSGIGVTTISMVMGGVFNWKNEGHYSLFPRE